MSIIEIVSISIAFLSLIISIYVVIRDKRNLQLELLMTMYDRLEASNSELQINQDKEISNKLKWKIDRELETSCFMLFKKKIDEEMFYHLYYRWLLSRKLFWTENKNTMPELGNNPYTAWAIKNGIEKGYLEISKKKQNFLKEMTDFITEKKITKKNRRIKR